MNTARFPQWLTVSQLSKSFPGLQESVSAGQGLTAAANLSDLGRQGLVLVNLHGLDKRAVDVEHDKVHGEAA